MQSVRTQEARNKTYDWFKSEVLPAGDLGTKIIMVGNLLHQDSLLRRLQHEIDGNFLPGTHREYPIVDNDETILWSGKFPNLEAIEIEKKKIANDIAWQREFLLKIVPPEDQVVHREWIQYYTHLPDRGNLLWTKIAVDLAISLKSSADYTAMVTGSLYSVFHNPVLYIHPFPVNERLDFPTALDKAKQLANTIGKYGTEIIVEEVAYQQAFPQSLKRELYKATGVKVVTDKRSRLTGISHLIKNGNVLFPKVGADLLISQITGFGVEKHDDLMDAFVMLANAVLNNRSRKMSGIGKPDKI